MFCETKLQNEPSANVSIDGYNIPIITYTEANKGGVCIYVADNLNFKLRNDLNIYESKELESVFIEIVNAKKANNIIIIRLTCQFHLKWVARLPCLF